MAVATGNRDDVGVGLEAGGHGPHDVAHIEDVNVLVNQDALLELTKRGEGEHGGVALTALVRSCGLLELQDGAELAATAGSSVDVEQTAGHSLVDHVEDGSLGRDASHGDMLVRRADAGLHDGVLAGGHSRDVDDRANLGATGVAS